MKQARVVPFLLAVCALGMLSVVAWFALGSRWQAAPHDGRLERSLASGPSAEPLEGAPLPAREAVPVAAPATQDPSPEGAPRAHPSQAAVAESGRFELVVTDEGGIPVAGAAVALRRGSNDLPIEDALSDEAGRATLRKARAKDRLGVRADGYEPVLLLVPEPPWRGPTVVVLPRGDRWLAGLLVDDTGSPIADVTLSMSAHATQFRTRTDAQGRFEFRARFAGPPPEASFRVDGGVYRGPAGGAHLPWSEWIARGWPVLVAERLAVLTLTVEDPSGEAVDDASVLIRKPPDPATGRWSPGSGILTHARAAGERAGGRPYYVLRPPAEVPLWIEVARVTDPIMWMGGPEGASEYALVELGSLAPAQRVVRTVRLEPTGLREARFVVRDEAGASIPGATAWIAVHGLTRRSSLRRTDEEGSFTVVPPPDPWSVTVRANGYALWKADYEPGFAAGEEVRVVMQGSDVGIEVLARDEHGEPLAGVVLSIEDEADGQQVGNGMTGDDGLFVWRGLEPAATYRVVPDRVHRTLPPEPLDHDGREHVVPDDRVPDPPSRHGVRAGRTRVEFRMVAPASIDGVVLGTPAPGSIVVLRGPRGGLQEMTSDGRFAFVGLSPGHYRLSVETLDDDGPVLAEVDVTPGEVRGGVELRLR